VMEVPPPKRDNMESFWLVSCASSFLHFTPMMSGIFFFGVGANTTQAETLKYFYLLFGPNDVLPLDKIVINTEAHAFPRFDPSKKRFKTGWTRIPRNDKGELVYGEKKDEAPKTSSAA
jgi:hypothetical protein